jgi:guanylate kinase
MRTWIVLVAALFLSVPALSRAELCGDLFAGPAGTAAASSARIIVLSAPSGGGKTTLAQLLLSDFPNLKLSISSTTRSPRGQEKDGVDYHFLTVADFKAKIARGDFAEYAEVHGNFYGTDASVIRGEFARGNSVLALLDVQGADKIKAAFPGQVSTIFISPPDMATLEARLRGRGTDTEEAIQLRMANAQKEMEEASKFDHVVVNGDLDEAHHALAQLLRDQHLVPQN